MNDVSARCLQAQGLLTISKGYETLLPMGPWMVTKDEVRQSAAALGEDLHQRSRSVRCPHIGDALQHPEVGFTWAVARGSARPGRCARDRLAAPGPGMYHDPPLLAVPGDTMRVEMKSIGWLSNPVVAAQRSCAGKTLVSLCSTRSRGTAASVWRSPTAVMLSVAALTDAVANKGIPMNRDRRRMLALGASALAGPVFIKRAVAADGAALVQAAVDRFARIPATASCLVVVDHPRAPRGGPRTIPPRACSSAARSRRSSWRATCATSRKAGSPWTGSWRSATRRGHSNSTVFLDLGGGTGGTACSRP